SGQSGSAPAHHSPIPALGVSRSSDPSQGAGEVVSDLLTTDENWRTEGGASEERRLPAGFCASPGDVKQRKVEGAGRTGTPVGLIERDRLAGECSVVPGEQSGGQREKIVGGGAKREDAQPSAVLRRGEHRHTRERGDAGPSEAAHRLRAVDLTSGESQ